MTSVKMTHAFISFSSKDEKLARTLCDDMEYRGIRCWICSRDVRPGRNYQTEIIDAIRSATHLLLVFSDNASRSAEVARELSLASKHQVHICPVRVQDVQPSSGMEYMLATSQWVDAFRNWELAMDQLANELRGPDATVIMRAPRPVRRRAAPLLAAAGAAGLLATGAAYLLLAPRRAPAPPASTAAAAAPVAAAAAGAASASGRPADPTSGLDAVGRLATTLDCARVTVLPSQTDGVALSGFVQSVADRRRLIEAAGALPVQDHLDVAPWPFCAARALGPELAAADDIAIEINHPDGRYTVGDSFSGSVMISGTAPLWVQADLIEFDGAVTHLLLGAGQPHPIPAGDRVSFGGPDGGSADLQAAEPAGGQILLIVASDTRMPEAPKAYDNARAYLPWLHDTLARRGGQLSVSVRSLVIAPRPGP